MAHLIIVQNLDDTDEFLRLVIISVVIPLMLYSTLKYTLFVSLIFNLLTFCIINPLIKGLKFDSCIIGLLATIASVLCLTVYDKALTVNIWGKLKTNLTNDELLQVVNASNQGVLIFCCETNRLLLQNATARRMFSDQQSMGSTYYFYG